MNRVSSPAQPARLVIAGGHRLEGEVTLSGAKNAALPILAASLLADGPCTLRRVPVNADIDTLCQILDQLGVTVTREPNGVIRTECTGPIDAAPDENLVRAMRGSICLLGPLLARRRPVRLALLGGNEPPDPLPLDQQSEDDHEQRPLHDPADNRGADRAAGREIERGA